MTIQQLAARLGCSSRHARRLKAAGDPRVAVAEAAWREEQQRKPAPTVDEYGISEEQLAGIAADIEREAARLPTAKKTLDAALDAISEAETVEAARELKKRFPTRRRNQKS